MYRRITALALVVTTSWLNLWVAAPVWSRDSRPLSPGLQQRLDKLTLATLQFAHEVLPLIDRSSFDLGALLEKLDYDCTRIAEFVTSSIGFEAYPGLMRGAQGTLMSRAGNAWDQSILLATLLKDAGCEATMRSGRLPESEASRLIQSLARRPLHPSPWNDEAMEAAFARIGSRLAEDFEATDEARSSAEHRQELLPASEMMSDAIKDRDRISAALGRAGIVLGSGDGLSTVISESTDYAWVEYRSGPSDPWTVAHPSFGESKPPEVVARQTYTGSIPPELTHRLRIELEAEQRLGDQIQSRPLMNSMELPTANLAGGSLSLALLPDQFLRNDVLDSIGTADELVAKTRFLIPLINGNLPPGGQAMSLDGTLVPPEALAMGAAGLFEEVSQKFDTAASLLADLGDSSENEPAAKMRTLKSLTLKVSLMAPNRTERRIERVLYSEDGVYPPPLRDPASSKAEIAKRLAQHHQLAIATGTLSPGFVLEATLNRLNAIEPWLQAFSGTEIGSCDSPECLHLPKLELPSSRTDLSAIFSLFDQMSSTIAGTRIYRSSPNIVRLSRPFFGGLSPTARLLDIMNNQKRAFSVADGGLSPSPTAVMLDGVWHTYIERYVPGEVGQRSALDYLSAADREGLPLEVWNADRIRSEKNLGISADTLLGMDSAGDKVVLIPPSSTRSMDSDPGWWLVDKETGRTLGMTLYGGATSTEYLVAAIVGLGGLIFVLVNGLLIYECWTSEFSYEGEEAGPSLYPSLGACAQCANITSMWAGFTRGLVAVLGATKMDNLSETFSVAGTDSIVECIFEVGGFYEYE